MDTERVDAARDSDRDRLESELRQRWTRAFAPAGYGDEPVSLLLKRWQEPARCYHTLDHLLAVLENLDRLGRPDPAVVLAAWYHDAVYDPAQPENEEASATLARTELARAGVEPDVSAETARLILLTRTHRPSGSDGAGAMLCDADLAVLGSTPEAYDSYRRAVRREYGTVSDDDWVEGRSKVLEDLLARPSLFSTEAGRALWETAARENLSRELAGLGHNQEET